MSIKYRGNSRDEQWRERQRQKQRERKEVEEKAGDKAKDEAGTAIQEEPERQTGAVEVLEAVEQGNSAEPGKTTEPPHG